MTVIFCQWNSPPHLRAAITEESPGRSVGRRSPPGHQTDVAHFPPELFRGPYITVRHYPAQRPVVFLLSRAFQIASTHEPLHLPRIQTNQPFLANPHRKINPRHSTNRFWPRIVRLPSSISICAPNAIRRHPTLHLPPWAIKQTSDSAISIPFPYPLKTLSQFHLTARYGR